MTIKEVSSMFDLSQDTLRFYEKKGLIGPIMKTSGGIRNYSDNDLKRIEFIKCMRGAGLPVDVLKKYVDLFELGDASLNDRRKILEEQKEILKEKIDRMQEAYDKLTYKINLYNSGNLEKLLDSSKK